MTAMDGVEKPLRVGGWVCGSCAVVSISYVGFCKNPVDVISQFCEHELGKRTAFRDTYPKLTCFYIFCAGPEVPSTAPNGSHHSKDHWPRYGTELAEYIVKHKLGEIGTVSPKLNAKHHPTTTAQVWIWSPDQEAVEAWWNKLQGF